MSTLDKAQTIFGLSFISNANFGIDAPLGDPQTTTDGTLWTNAQQTISSGIATINQNLPAANAASITWGPYLKPSASRDPKATDLSVANNTMYVASLADPDPNKPNNQLLVVSIAGTSSTSYVAAMDEDFGVSLVSLYLPNQMTSDALVYTGGNAVLQDMVGQQGVKNYIPGWLDVNRAIKDFVPNLLAQIGVLKKNGKSVEVVVTGHSLGGGLAPLLAGYLSSYPGIKGITGISVSCYTYAGPTSGNLAFWNYLKSNGVFLNASVNEFDIVPKAWITDGLNGIPGLYSGENDQLVPSDFEDCDGNNSITPDPIVQGIVDWAGSLLNKNPDVYAYPDRTIFAGQGLDFKTSKKQFKGEEVSTCTYLDSMSGLIYEPAGDPQLQRIHDNLQCIWHKIAKTTDDIPYAVIHHFLTFTTEAGHQHVKAYIDKIINPSTLSSFNDYLSNFMAGAKFNDAEFYDKMNILDTILSDTVTYLGCDSH